MTSSGDPQDPTLWRISAFERERQAGGHTRAGGPTLLPTTLMDDLRQLDRQGLRGDVIEILASCMRHRDAALLYLRHAGLVWPLTVFPLQELVHCPRDLLQADPDALADLRVLTVDPPGVRPPGHHQTDRIANLAHYRALKPLLWQLALHGPRSELIGEIGGTAAYRVAPAFEAHHLPAPGALGPARERLRLQTTALRDIARWPGMSVDRASRLLNALYLTGGLMLSRTHPAAREAPAPRRGWFGIGRG